MLRMTLNRSAVSAKSYYTQADYYLDGSELEGVWRGKAAARLGLSGAVEREAWESLCDNRHPKHGTPLTPRQRDDRRVGYDFNFHAPKSLSLLYAFTRDARVLAAFQESVRETMEDMETEMQTRVRSRGRNEDRQTGNMVWGEFTHFTGRPVDGIPDPHLHMHCFVHNTTWDSKEHRWKAGQFAGLKRDAPYFEALFHARLADRLERLGIGTRRTQRGWEVDGISRDAIERFSRRTAQVEARANELGVTHPDSKGELGAKTRESKGSLMPSDAIALEWLARLGTHDANDIRAIQQDIGCGDQRTLGSASEDAVRHAVSHSFERSAVVPERRVLAEALRYGVGKASAASIQEAFAREPLISAHRDGRCMVTTRDVLREESEMVAFARDGRGACRPLGSGDYAVSRDWLNSDQREAIRHLLTSPDRVMVVRGAAGTGKTSMMQEAVEAMQAGGHRVHCFAPSAEASRDVLRSEGFGDADTVARLLIDEKMQQKLRNQVIWVDEAGLLSSRDMSQLFALADRENARVILSGDHAQHGSVGRGAVLRLLDDEAGVKPAEIREIHRQSGRYKQAVGALSRGDVYSGFKELDDLKWIKEYEDGDRYQALAEEYVESCASSQETLVVSPTHSEGAKVTEAIRDALKDSGRLARRDHAVLQLVDKRLTLAERMDDVNYSVGDVVVFHQNAKGGYVKGQRLVVGEDVIPLDAAERFGVFRQAKLNVTRGDRLRITKNGSTKEGKHRLNNGAVYSVKSIARNGDIELDNGWKVAADYGHIAHGYCTTSHASQGKSVDRVLVAESAESFPAGSREQFYVSVSRAKHGVSIYTDDKQALLEAVSEGDDRLTATDLVASRSRREPPRHRRRVRDFERSLSAREEMTHDR